MLKPFTRHEESLLYDESLLRQVTPKNPQNIGNTETLLLSKQNPAQCFKVSPKQTTGELSSVTRSPVKRSYRAVLAAFK